MADVLVTTDWVAKHAADAGVRVVEVDVDTTAYDQGHGPGAAGPVPGWNRRETKVPSLRRRQYGAVPAPRLRLRTGFAGRND